MKIGGIFRGVFRVITAPFRFVIAIANFLRALIVIMFFALLILVLAYVFSGKVRSSMNEFIFEKKQEIVPKKLFFREEPGDKTRKNLMN